MKFIHLVCACLMLGTTVLAQTDASSNAKRLPSASKTTSDATKRLHGSSSPAVLPGTDLNFATAVDYGSGGYFAESVAVADVNGDGKPDVVVANRCVSINTLAECNQTNGSVAVLLGNGDGTFQAAVTYSSGGYGAYSVAIADVNGDGKPDLVVANGAYPGTVGVLLGNGDGTFQTAVIYSSGGSDASSVAIADVNGDGKPDLVVANAGSDTVGVLLGNGDGTFQTAVTYSSGGIIASSVAIADVNGDGKPDLVVVNNCGNDSNCNSFGTVGVLLGNGDGTFQTAVTYAAGAIIATSVAVADVNGDGKPDLVVGNSLVGVGVLLGNGDGTFQPVVTYSTTNAYSVAVADVNGDGKPDVIAGTGDTGLEATASVLLGNGDGTFQTVMNFGAGGHWAQSVAVADVNGDSKPDVIVADLCNDASCTMIALVGVLLNNSGSTTATSLVSSLNPSNFGQSVTFTATVTSTGFPGTPTGTVSLYDGTTNIANPALNGSGVAVFTTSTLAAGTHSMTAAYYGDTNFMASTSPVLNQVVQGAGVILSPSGLSFGDQVLNVTSPPLSVALVNTGNIALSITSLGLTGANSNEFSQTNNCPSSIPANGGCTISVTFTPAVAGNATASITIADNAPGSPQNVPLTGVGNGAVVSLSPLSVTFPSQYVGTSGLPQTVTLTNSGTTALTITNVIASTADFGVLNACGGSVAAGSNCAIGVFFDPTTTGTRTGTLTVTDNASGSPQTVALSGMGQDFSMAPSGSGMANVTPGQTASYTVAVAPGGGFDQTVALSCSGAPAQSTCALSSSSVALNGSKAAMVTVTVTTAGTSASLAHPTGISPTGSRLALWLGFGGLSGIVILGSSSGRSRKRRDRLMRGLALLCLFSLGTTWLACGGGGGNGNGGGGSGSGTPAGTYNLTVTGTFASGATTLSHAAKLTLVVQ